MSILNVALFVLTLTLLQLSPAHTSHHLCRMVQSILLVSSEAAVDSPTSSTTGSSRHGNSTSSSSQLTGLSGLSLSPSLRAHTYITLGELIEYKYIPPGIVMHFMKTKFGG